MSEECDHTLVRTSPYGQKYRAPNAENVCDKSGRPTTVICLIMHVCYMCSWSVLAQWTAVSGTVDRTASGATPRLASTGPCDKFIHSLRCRQVYQSSQRSNTETLRSICRVLALEMKTIIHYFKVVKNSEYKPFPLPIVLFIYLFTYLLK